MHLEHIGSHSIATTQGSARPAAPSGGASINRTAYVADITGQAILHVLYEQLMKHLRLV